MFIEEHNLFSSSPNYKFRERAAYATWNMYRNFYRPFESFEIVFFFRLDFFRQSIRKKYFYSPDHLSSSLYIDFVSSRESSQKTKDTFLKFRY